MRQKNCLLKGLTPGSQLEELESLSCPEKQQYDLFMCMYSEISPLHDFVFFSPRQKAQHVHRTHCLFLLAFQLPPANIKTFLEADDFKILSSDLFPEGLTKTRQCHSKAELSRKTHLGFMTWMTQHNTNTGNLGGINHVVN